MRSPKGTAETNPNAIPFLISHIARTMTRIEQQRLVNKVPDPAAEGFAGFDLHRIRAKPREELQSMSVQLRCAEAVLGILLFRTQRIYWKRLARVRNGLDLNGFRRSLEEFLAEWADSTLLVGVFVRQFERYLTYTP